MAKEVTQKEKKRTISLFHFPQSKETKNKQKANKPASPTMLVRSLLRPQTTRVAYTLPTLFTCTARSISYASPSLSSSSSSSLSPSLSLQRTSSLSLPTLPFYNQVRGFKGKKKPSKSAPPPRIIINNSLLKHETLLVLKDGGEKLGEMPSKDALKMARQEGMDLILVSDKAKPAVAKIMKLGKHKMELKRAEKKRAANQPKPMKECRVTFSIGANDLAVKIKKMHEWAEKGHPIKLLMKKKGMVYFQPDDVNAYMRKVFHKVQHDLHLYSKTPAVPQHFGVEESAPNFAIFTPLSEKEKEKKLKKIADDKEQAATEAAKGPSGASA